MSKPVPKFVAEQYTLGAHGFRSEKRRQLRLLRKTLDELRLGCAFFPCSEKPVQEIEKQIDVLTESLSVKNWGR